MDNKDIVRRYIDRVWNQHDHSAIDETIRADFVQHARIVSIGREGVHGFFKMIDAAFSDVIYTLDDILGDGDKVAFRWTLRATHTGPFQGIPATNKSFDLTGISIVRLENGQLAENWVEQDIAGLMQQLRS